MCHLLYLYFFFLFCRWMENGGEDSTKVISKCNRWTYNLSIILQLKKFFNATV